MLSRLAPLITMFTLLAPLMAQSRVCIDELCADALSVSKNYQQVPERGFWQCEINYSLQVGQGELLHPLTSRKPRCYDLLLGKVGQSLGQHRFAGIFHELAHLPGAAESVLEYDITNPQALNCTIYVSSHVRNARRLGELCRVPLAPLEIHQ
jgi:hypothetical protein